MCPLIRRGANNSTSPKPRPDKHMTRFTSEIKIPSPPFPSSPPMAEVEPDLSALPIDDDDDDDDDDIIDVSDAAAMADLAGTLADPSHFWPSPNYPLLSSSDLLDDPLCLSLELFDRRRSPSAPPDPSALGSVHREGLQIAGFGEAGDDAPDLCWDCLRMDEDLEWEEVDGGSCLDEREEVLSMMVGVEVEVEEEEVGSDGMDELHHDAYLDLEELHEHAADWEDLLAGDNVELLYVEDQEGFMNTSEYEVLFGQFDDDESAVRGSPPAAKSAVDNLPSIVLGVEGAGCKNNTLCAVCKDEISSGEAAKQLPCLHHYHGDCILQWLRIRNTCPVCRYELPTDDPEYENLKARRRAGGVVSM